MHPKFVILRITYFTQQFSFYQEIKNRSKLNKNNYSPTKIYYIVQDKPRYCSMIIFVNQMIKVWIMKMGLLFTDPFLLFTIL